MATMDEKDFRRLYRDDQIRRLRAKVRAIKAVLAFLETTEGLPEIVRKILEDWIESQPESMPNGAFGMTGEQQIMYYASL